MRTLLKDLQHAFNGYIHDVMLILHHDKKRLKLAVTCSEYTGPTYTDMHPPLSGGGAESPAGSEREGAAGDEGRSRGAELTQATKLPTAKQGV